MFLFEDYLNEEKDSEEKAKKIEAINPKELDVKTIHKVLKGIPGLRRLSLDQHSYASHTDDGRRKINARLEFKDDVEIEKCLEKIVEELSGYEIKITNLVDDEKKDVDDKSHFMIANKSVSMDIFCKFGAKNILDKLKSKMSFPTMGQAEYEKQESGEPNIIRVKL